MGEKPQNVVANAAKRSEFYHDRGGWIPNRRLAAPAIGARDEPDFFLTATGPTGKINV
jgi:hypothetical protein